MRKTIHDTISSREITVNTLQSSSIHKCPEIDAANCPGILTPPTPPPPPLVNPTPGDHFPLLTRKHLTKIIHVPYFLYRTTAKMFQSSSQIVQRFDPLPPSARAPPEPSNGTPLPSPPLHKTAHQKAQQRAKSISTVDRRRHRREEPRKGFVVVAQQPQSLRLQ